MVQALTVLLTLLRLYTLLIFVWALMTWIPGLAGSAIHDIIGWPIIPLLNLLSFARIGFVGLQAIVLLLLVCGLEVLIKRWLKKLGGAAPESSAATTADHQ